MNQEKIGKFIAECRKKKGMTQEELSEKIGVSRKSVSRWENGKNMPDLSLFKPLCEVLDITINELMSGEKVPNKNYNEKLEENIINTIDYIDKKNNKKNDMKNIVILILGIIGICLSQFIFNDHQVQGYLTVVCTILIVYSTKQLFMKYKWVRRIVAVILFLICIITMVLN